MCTGKTVAIVHFVATVSTRVSSLTNNQKSTVGSSLVTWSRCWRCALLNSRAARSVFAATVNDTQNRQFWMRKFTGLLNFLETTEHNVATEGDFAKTASSRTLFLRSSTVFASCKSVSMTYFCLQKCLTTCTVTAEFKVQSNSTCAYIRSIRNYGILIYCYARAAHTEQYPATLRYSSFQFCSNIRV